MYKGESEREIRQQEGLSIGQFPRLERQIVDRVIMELGGKWFWYLTQTSQI